MIRFLARLYRIIGPFGVRPLVGICLLQLLSALAQMAAVFSILPFLTAASDVAAFRRSQLGAAYAALAGDPSDSGLLLTAGLVSLALLVAGNAVTLGVDWARGRYAFGVGQQIRARVVGDLLRRRYLYFTSLNSSTLLKNIVEDVAIFSQAILVPLLDIGARLILALILVVYVAVMEPLITFAGAALVGLYVVAVIVPVRRHAAGTSEEIKDAIRALYFEVGQTLAGIKPILAGGVEDHFRARCVAASAALARLLPRTVIFPAIPRAGLEVVVFGGLIGWVLWSLMHGEDLASLTPRVGVVALVAYRLMPSLQLVLSQSIAISVMRQSMDELLRLIDEQERYAVPAPADPAARLAFARTLRFADVSFRYPGAASDALAGIDLTIARGEHVAFVGPTGSGKSTLLDLVLGLAEPSGGAILVDDVALDDATRPAWRAVLGFVPQDLFMLDAAVAENIAFGATGAAIDMARVRDAAARAQADDFIARGGGYAQRVGERGVRLSGGQRQRLGLARALYRDPAVLVLDEATSALDPATERDVVAAVLAAADGLTTITVAHRLSTVAACDRIYFLQHGRVTAVGTFAELVATVPAFHAFAYAPAPAPAAAGDRPAPDLPAVAPGFPG